MEDVTSITILLRAGPTTWRLIKLTPDNCGPEWFAAVAANLDQVEEPKGKPHCINCGAPIGRGLRCMMHARQHAKQRVLASSHDYLKSRIAEGA